MTVSYFILSVGTEIDIFDDFWAFRPATWLDGQKLYEIDDRKMVLYESKNENNLVFNPWISQERVNLLSVLPKF